LIALTPPTLHKALIERIVQRRGRDLKTSVIKL